LSELGFGQRGKHGVESAQDSLTDDETKTRLIYSSDESGTLIKKYANTAKRIT
jgi:hypothetical protein